MLWSDICIPLTALHCSEVVCLDPSARGVGALSGFVLRSVALHPSGQHSVRDGNQCLVTGRFFAKLKSRSSAAHKENENAFVARLEIVFSLFMCT